MLVKNDDDNVYNSMFTFIEKSDEEKEDVDKVTLVDLKQTLDTYSPQKLKILTSVLIDSLCELTTEKEFLDNSLEIFSR